jgi:hypothetical protein
VHLEVLLNSAELGAAVLVCFLIAGLRQSKQAESLFQEAQ